MTVAIEVLGHRGWPAKYPDNTLSGFLAVAPFCDAIEVDVRRSLDGKLVLAHDERLGKHQVAKTPWPILAEVDLGGGHRPCLLDEALAVVPDTAFMIEIKNNPWDTGFEPDHRLALEAASRARAGDMVTSFNWATADRVAESFDNVRTGLIVGVLGHLADASDHAQREGHRLVVPNIRLLEAVNKPLDSVGDGPDLFVWASDEKDLRDVEPKELVSKGVSGIITDDPVSTRHRLENSP